MTPKLSPVPPGDDLIEHLQRIRDPEEGWVQGSGYVEDIEVQVLVDGVEEMRSLPGRHILLSLMGPLGGPLSVMLATGDSSQMVGGMLTRARSAGLTLALFQRDRSKAADSSSRAGGPSVPTFAAVSAANPYRVNPQAVLATPVAIPTPLHRAASSGSARTPEAAAREGWSAAAAASDAAARAHADEEEEHIPQEGDLVEHFAFGLCDVVQSDGDRLRIRDQKGASRVREVSLVMLRVLPPTEVDGRRVYRLARK